jgi:hypothetical protein
MATPRGKATHSSKHQRAILGGRAREGYAMTDTTTEPGLNLPAVTKDPTAALRQRRYRQRKSVNNRHCDRDDRNAPPVTVSSDGVTVLCAEQSKITIEFDEHGNALLRQSEWPDDDDVILIRRDNIPDFIDRLTDALGIPSFGRP